MRTLLKDFLTSQGYRVSCFANGTEALEALHNLTDSVDAVVCDLVVPGVDGIGVLRAMKIARPETPLILITAHGTEESADQAALHGAAAYFIKPFKLKHLASVISGHIIQGK